MGPESIQQYWRLWHNFNQPKKLQRPLGVIWKLCLLHTKKAILLLVKDRDGFISEVII